ncbi:hypothetical protein HDV06_005843 [Boothiomyces sp. JEL0866]|nr:hypothetical protein HDV06_005843 [Boothiomyces sp. JEL0866]
MLILSLVRLALASSVQQVLETKKLTFLAIGDWGADYNLPYLRMVADQMDIKAEQTDADFVIALGDNFYNDGVTSPDDPKWKVLWFDSFTGRTRDLQWYCILGNHDWYGNEDAQLEFSVIHPQWYMPDYFYTKSFEYDSFTIGFIFIDTDLLFYGYFGQLSDDFASKGWSIEKETHLQQLQWIQDQFDAMKNYEYVVVLGHHHLVTCNDEDSGIYMQDLLNIIEDNAASAYIYGHKHTLKSAKKGNTLFIQSGAGGQSEGLCTINTPGSYSVWGQGGTNGFVSVEVTGSQLYVEFTDRNGVSLHSDYIFPRQ